MQEKGDVAFMEATIKPFKFLLEGAVSGEFRILESLLP